MVGLNGLMVMCWFVYVVVIGLISVMFVLFVMNVMIVCDSCVLIDSMCDMLVFMNM